MTKILLEGQPDVLPPTNHIPENSGTSHPVRQHIAILSHQSVLEKILAGQKTVESRLSRLKQSPFGEVAVGDIIHFKLSGEQIVGRAEVARVEEYENLNPTKIRELALLYQKEQAISADTVARKSESKFATLIFLTNIEAVEPWAYKQNGRAGWLVLSDKWESDK